MAVGASVLEFTGDASATQRFIRELYHAAPATTAAPSLRYRITTDAGGSLGYAPGRPPFGPAPLEEIFAFLEWRVTEDVLNAPAAGEVYVHAAGVVVGVHPLLIVGASGAGKSTLAAHLTAMGGRSWGDDVVRFALESGLFSAFPRSWKIDGKTLTDIDLISRRAADAAEGILFASSSWYVSPAAIRRDWSAEAGRPDAVVVLDGSRHDAPVRVERMSEGEAAVRVSTALLSAGAGRGPAWSEIMVRVLEALRDVVAWRAGGGPPAALARAVAAEVAA